MEETQTITRTLTMEELVALPVAEPTLIAHMVAEPVLTTYTVEKTVIRLRPIISDTDEAAKIFEAGRRLLENLVAGAFGVPRGGLPPGLVKQLSEKARADAGKDWAEKYRNPGSFSKAYCRYPSFSEYIADRREPIRDIYGNPMQTESGNMILARPHFRGLGRHPASCLPSRVDILRNYHGSFSSSD